MRRKEGKYGAAVVSDATAAAATAAAPRLAVRGEVRRFNGSLFYHAELLFPRRRNSRETGRAVALGSVECAFDEEGEVWSWSALNRAARSGAMEHRIFSI